MKTQVCGIKTMTVNAIKYHNPIKTAKGLNNIKIHIQDFVYW